MVSRQHLTFPRVMMAACEACRRVSPDARQDAEGARGRRGNATNDSDADIGDKSYHRFGAVFREGAFWMQILHSKYTPRDFFFRISIFMIPLSNAPNPILMGYNSTQMTSLSGL